MKASALFLGTVIAATALPAVAQEEIVFGISANPGSLQHLTADEFARLANERLGDSHQVVVYGASQLGNDRELLQKLILGTVHITLPSSIMSTVSPQFGLFDMPFVIADRAHLARVEEEVFWPDIAPTVEEQGYRVIALWENGIRHITNSTRPIDTPADLEGIKLRTPRGEWRIRMFEAWGASPTPMPFSEVFVSLQTGVIDGQENPLTNISAASFQEVQDFLSITGHVYSPAYPTVGIDAWEELPEDVRQVLADTAREVALWARDQGAAADETLLAELESAGMQVNVADREAFVSASQPIYDAFAEEVEGGGDLIGAALSLAE